MKTLYVFSVSCMLGILCMCTGCASPQTKADDDLLGDVVFDDRVDTYAGDIIFDDGFDFDPDAVALPADDRRLPGAHDMPGTRTVVQPDYTSLPAIPAPRTYPQDGPTVSPTRTPTRPAAGTHTVVRGDTLWGISRQYGVTVADIARANNMDPNATLRIGAQLQIPGAESAPASPTRATPTGGTTYTVQRGDTWYSIARRYGMSYQELMNYNGARDSLLREGQEIRIP